MKKAIVKMNFFPDQEKKKCICNARHETFACVHEGRPGLVPSHSSRVTSEQNSDWKNEINPILFFSLENMGCIFC